MLNVERISERTWRSRQALHGEAIEKYTGLGRPVLVRATIKRDSYDFQSAKVETYSVSTETWSPLLTRPITDLPIADSSYVAKDGDWEHWMGGSLNDLLDEAQTLMEATA